MSLFSAVEMAPRDPILGLNEAFNADTRPNKVNLGVGVYYNEEGRIPLLRAVVEAEHARIAAHAPRGYLPIEGIAAYDAAVQKLLFGNDSPLIAEGRVVTTQALGGTGALKVGADFLKRLLPDAVVAISNPSWENHRALFESAGFPVQNYSYYNASTHGIDRAGLLQDLKNLPPRSIVVLHACCHNPTGVDLNLDDWKQILDVLRAQDHVPFIDIAYQGFGDSIEEDAVNPPDNLRLVLFSGAGRLPVVAKRTAARRHTLPVTTHYSLRRHCAGRRAPSRAARAREIAS